MLKFYHFCSVLYFVGQPTKTHLELELHFFSKCYIFLTCAVLILTKQKRKRRKREKPSHKLDSNYKLLTVLTIKENSIIDFWILVPCKIQVKNLHFGKLVCVPFSLSCQSTVKKFFPKCVSEKIIKLINTKRPFRCLSTSLL